MLLVGFSLAGWLVIGAVVEVVLVLLAVRHDRRRTAKRVPRGTGEKRP